MNNREIKFRIYYPLEKTFLYFDIYEGYPSGLYGSVSPPQQFTGLKDSQGKDIYEGDILKCKNFDGWFDKVGYYSNMEVKHSISLSGESEISGFVYIPVDREIVGNVFETPELLQ